MPDVHVSKRITCIVPGCDWTETAPTEDALMEKVAAHAAHGHAIKEITPELAAQVKAAIKDA